MRKIAIEEHVNKNSIHHIEQRIQDMNDNGIEIQVLSWHDLSDGVKATVNVEDAKRTNDLVKKIVERYPKRFRAFADLPVMDTSGAAKELERCVKDLNYVGAMINPAADYLDDPKYEELYAAAQELQVPIYVHPGSAPASLIQDFTPYPGLSRALLGYAMHISLQALRMILSGVFDRYPDLKIILGHLGEGLPYWLYRLDSRYAGERRFSQETDAFYAYLNKRPSEYFLENFYITTSGMFWYPPLQCAIQACGAERILFAVDYPYESVTEASEFIDIAPIDENQRAQISHENAEELLHIIY